MRVPTRLVLVRHGQTDWNAGQRIQGHTDIPLNALGRWQATQLALALAEEDFDAVYASDLARASETATPFAAGRLQLEPGLRERHFGAFEGLSFAQIEQRWPAQARLWRLRDPAFGPPGGEMLADFSARCVAVVDRLARRHAGGSIALVAHGGVLDSLYRAATSVPLAAPRSWEIGNATINRLLHTDGGFTLVGWNDDGHLTRTPDLTLG